MGEVTVLFHLHDITSPEDPGGPFLHYCPHEIRGWIREESGTYRWNRSPREQQKKPGKGYLFLLCPDSSTARSPAIPSAATDIPPGRGDFCVRVEMGV